MNMKISKKVFSPFLFSVSLCIICNAPAIFYYGVENNQKKRAKHLEMRSLHHGNTLWPRDIIAQERKSADSL